MITEAQKTMLENMRDNGWFIIQSYTSYNYSLRQPADTRPVGGTKIRSIKSAWMNELNPFFVRNKNDDHRITIYTLRPDAELTDAWLEAENQKQIQELVDKKAAEINEKERQNQMASAWFYTGPGPYQVVMSGQWPFGGSIQFNGMVIANISAVHYSTNDNTFADVLIRPKNVSHFEAIREMVKAANMGAK